MRAAAVVLALALGCNAFAPAPTARSSTQLNAAGHAVIVQNKGGGHGEIGFHLAKNLADKDLTVTIVQDSAAKKEANGFKKYGAPCNVPQKTTWSVTSAGTSSTTCLARHCA